MGGAGSSFFTYRRFTAAILLVSASAFAQEQMVFPSTSQAPLLANNVNMNGGSSFLTMPMGNMNGGSSFLSMPMG